MIKIIFVSLKTDEFHIVDNIDNIVSKGLITELESDEIFTHCVTDIPYKEKINKRGWVYREVHKCEISGTITKDDILQIEKKAGGFMTRKDIANLLKSSRGVINNIMKTGKPMTAYARRNSRAYYEMGEFKWWEKVNNVDDFYKYLDDASVLVSYKYGHRLDKESIKDYALNYLSNYYEDNFPHKYDDAYLAYRTCDKVTVNMIKRINDGYEIELSSLSGNKELVSEDGEYLI